MAKQFTYKQFERLLVRVADDNDTFYHCIPKTVQIIRDILTIDYPYQQDDIEYIADMVNFHLRSLQYCGDKWRFPISKYLDEICQGELYLSEFINFHHKNNAT